MCVRGWLHCGALFALTSKKMPRQVWYAVRYMVNTRDIAVLKKALAMKSPFITERNAPQSFSPYFHMCGHGKYVAGGELKELTAKLGVEIVCKK